MNDLNKLAAETAEKAHQVTCPICEERFDTTDPAAINIEVSGHDPIRRCPRCTQRENPCEYCLGFHDSGGCVCHDCGTQMHPQYIVCVERDGRPTVICPACNNRALTTATAEAQQRIAELERQLADKHQQIRTLQAERDDYHIKACNIADERDSLREQLAEAQRDYQYAIETNDREHEGQMQQLRADLAAARKELSFAQQTITLGIIREDVKRGGEWRIQSPNGGLWEQPHRSLEWYVENQWSIRTPSHTWTPRAALSTQSEKGGAA